ncbi:MAG TPA: hypothetical protein ENN40_09010 [Candidatus Aminicenantes bacterium]|nr:hypothetical protein [Candidatus Aminicenantes bacterium]
MLMRVFSLVYDSAAGGFDASVVNEFLYSRKLLRLETAFFVHDGVPQWSVLVACEEILPENESADKDPLEAGLNEWQRILLRRLREWRKAAAEKRGIPVFLVATNRQLQEIVIKAPDSLEKLRSIRGLGQKKVKDYGKEILELLAAFFKKK